MASIKTILAAVSHRPWDMPSRSWAYYQEWNKALFLHWKVSPKELNGLLPDGLELDLFEGQAWVSLVPFTMEKIRPRGLPPFAPISDFYEINLRTYVVVDGKPGVYFLNIEAGKRLAAVLAKAVSGLPYKKATMQRRQEGVTLYYTSEDVEKGIAFSVDFEVGKSQEHPDVLDLWLTERYCLYLENQERLIRYEIQHKPWELNEVRIGHLQTRYPLGGLDLSRYPDRVHYSMGVEVVAWNKEYLG